MSIYSDHMDSKRYAMPCDRYIIIGKTLQSHQHAHRPVESSKAAKFPISVFAVLTYEKVQYLLGYGPRSRSVPDLATYFH